MQMISLLPFSLPLSPCVVMSSPGEGICSSHPDAERGLLW